MTDTSDGLVKGLHKEKKRKKLYGILGLRNLRSVQRAITKLKRLEAEQLNFCPSLFLHYTVTVAVATVPSLMGKNEVESFCASNHHFDQPDLQKTFVKMQGGAFCRY